MVKNYKLTQIDCPNCAAKIERDINKMKEVDKASVSFITQRLTLEAEDITNELLDSIDKVIQKTESECSIIRK